MYRMWQCTVWQTDNVSGTPAASLFRADAVMTAACSTEMYLPYTYLLTYSIEQSPS
jgi:hypothetical protein